MTVQRILNMLATCAEDHPFEWEDYIRKICMAYNSNIATILYWLYTILSHV